MQRPLQVLHFVFLRNGEHPFGFDTFQRTPFQTTMSRSPSTSLIAPI